MRKRPGVLIYFDIRPALKMLSLEEKGQLFDAIMDYSELGDVPELEGMLGMAWTFIQPKLDRDGETYKKNGLRKRYSAYIRWARDKGNPELSFEDWLTELATKGDADACEYMQMHADDAISPTTSSTKTFISTSPSSTANAKGTTNVTTPGCSHISHSGDVDEALLRQQKIAALRNYTSRY